MINNLEAPENVVRKKEIVVGGKTVEVSILKASSDMDVMSYFIEASRDDMSVSQFMDRLGVFKFNDPIQRNKVWTIETKSILIVSILEEVSIGEIKTEVIRKSGKRYRNVLDGKQRLTTIRDYVRGRFALEESLVRGYDENGDIIYIDISGMYFDDLPKQYRDRIMSLILVIKGYEDLDENMKSELFQRWNSGESLKPSQLRKAKMSYELLFAIAELKSLDIFKAGFSERAIKTDLHSDMLLKTLAVFKTENNTGLDSKSINALLDANAFSEELIEELKKVSTFINEVYAQLDEKTAKKSFGASKTVSMLYVARKALDENRTEEQFAEWMHEFFVKDYTKSGFANRSGTAKLENVRKRNNKIMDHYNQFFKKGEVQN